MVLSNQKYIYQGELLQTNLFPVTLKVGGNEEIIWSYFLDKGHLDRVTAITMIYKKTFYTQTFIGILTN